MVGIALEPGEHRRPPRRPRFDRFNRQVLQHEPEAAAQVPIRQEKADLAEHQARYAEGATPERPGVTRGLTVKSVPLVRQRDEEGCNYVKPSWRLGLDSSMAR
jgi:hypothetical protein